jgi:hypothetical protein
MDANSEQDLYLALVMRLPNDLRDMCVEYAASWQHCMFWTRRVMPEIRGRRGMAGKPIWFKGTQTLYCASPPSPPSRAAVPAVAPRRQVQRRLQDALLRALGSLCPFLAAAARSQSGRKS